MDNSGFYVSPSHKISTLCFNLRLLRHWMDNQVHVPTKSVNWILFTNYSKLQLSSGVANSSGRFLLRTFDSIFAHFITSVQYIIILHGKFKRALHIGIIHDHQTNIKYYMEWWYIEIIHNSSLMITFSTNLHDIIVIFFDAWSHMSLWLDRRIKLIYMYI